VNKKIWLKSLPLVVLIIVLCIFPFVMREYFLDVMTFLLINLILVVSYRLITKMGLWSFAHISLMSVGGYTAGLLVIRLGFSFWGALPLGVLAAGATGLIIGLPLLRSKGFYFFLATFAAGEAIRWSYILFREPFGGQGGIGVIPRPDPVLGISFANPTNYYYLVLGFTLLSLAIIYRLENSRIGATIAAIGSNELLTKSIGINSFLYKNAVFVTAAAFAGLAGVLFSFYTGTASPGDYSFAYSINILIFVIAGGTASFAGPIIGTAVLTAVGEALRGYLEWVPLIYGIILIVIVLLEPQGLVALPKRISSQVEKWTGRRTM
jgi:branched-chain amino acid transport system permease protein